MANLFENVKVGAIIKFEQEHHEVMGYVKKGMWVSSPGDAEYVRLRRIGTNVSFLVDVRTFKRLNK